MYGSSFALPTWAAGAVVYGSGRPGLTLPHVLQEGVMVRVKLHIIWYVKSLLAGCLLT